MKISGSSSEPPKSGRVSPDPNVRIKKARIVSQGGVKDIAVIASCSNLSNYNREKKGIKYEKFDLERALETVRQRLGINIIALLDDKVTKEKKEEITSSISFDRTRDEVASLLEDPISNPHLYNAVLAATFRLYGDGSSEKVKQYIDIFTKKMRGEACTSEKESLLHDKNFRYLALHLTKKYAQAQNLLDALKNHDGDIYEASGGNGADLIFKFITPKDIRDSVGNKENIRLWGQSNGTFVSSALMSATGGRVKGVIGGRPEKDFPKKFLEPHGNDMMLLETAKSNAQKHSNITFTLEGEAPESPIIVSLAGGTPNMLMQSTILPDIDYHFNRLPVKDNSAIIEVHYPQSSFALLKTHMEAGLFDGREHIFIGHNLQKAKDKNYEDEYASFLKLCKSKKVKVYEGMPFGHGDKENYQRSPIPLGVKGILFKGDDGKAMLTFLPA